MPLFRQALAEFVGTALLLIAVVGSGIAAQRLSPSDVGLELLENAVVTGAALVAIILAVGSVSGGHLQRFRPDPESGRLAQRIRPRRQCDRPSPEPREDLAPDARFAKPWIREQQN